MRSLATLILLALPISAVAQSPDWNKTNSEALLHYQALIRIDSTDPPGNETQVVEYVKKVLEAEGIPVTSTAARKITTAFAIGSARTKTGATGAIRGTNGACTVAGTCNPRTVA